MSGEATKIAKEPFVPKYEIATGLHKGRKVEKFVSKRVRPTRRVNVLIADFVLPTFLCFVFLPLEKKQTS